MIRFWSVCMVIMGVFVTPMMAQEEESVGGINTPSGLNDLKSSQENGPFAAFPWDVQSLLEKNMDVLRKLPVPVQDHILNGAMDWDVWFDTEKQRLIQFFKKGKNLSQEEWGALWPQTDMQGYAIEAGMDRFVLGDVNPPKALVIVAILHSEKVRSGPVISENLLKEGVLLEGVDFGVNGLDTFLMGQGHAHLLERIRKMRKLKHPVGAIAVVDDIPLSLAGKMKGERKKNAPLIISTADLIPSLNMGEDLLDQAAGKSQKYLEMLMNKWTPEFLKMPNMYREKPIGYLTLGAMMMPEQSLGLGDAFKQKMVLRLLWRAQPDAILVTLSDEDETDRQIFLDRVALGLKSRERYKENALLVVLDEGQKQVYVHDSVGAQWMGDDMHMISQQVAQVLGLTGSGRTNEK